MKLRPIIAVFVTVSLMLACNLPTGSSQLESPPTSTETTAAPVETQPAAAATGTLTPTVTPSPTLSAPMVTPVKDPVNCRFSTDTTFEAIGSGLAVGASAQILGKSADGGWWQILSSSGNEKCWVAASVTTASGDLSKVPVVVAPLAFVTNLTLKIDPPSINLGVGCPGPAPLFSFKGVISVNGPTEVKWHFESQKGGVMPTHSISFAKYGSQNVSADYSPASLDKGSYWVRLIITSPNSMFEEAKYEIKCSS